MRSPSTARRVFNRLAELSDAGPTAPPQLPGLRQRQPAPSIFPNSCLRVFVIALATPAAKSERRRRCERTAFQRWLSHPPRSLQSLLYSSGSLLIPLFIPHSLPRSRPLLLPTHIRPTQGAQPRAWASPKAPGVSSSSLNSGTVPAQVFFSDVNRASRELRTGLDRCRAASTNTGQVTSLSHMGTRQGCANTHKYHVTRPQRLVFRYPQAEGSPEDAGARRRSRRLGQHAEGRPAAKGGERPAKYISFNLKSPLGFPLGYANEL